MGIKPKMQLYDKTRTKNGIVNGSGDYILDFICTSCSVEENLYSTEYFLDAEFIIDDEGLYKKIEEDMILKVQLDYGEEIFSIVDIRKTPTRITVFARQITISESQALWLKDVRPEKKNGQDALNHMLEHATGEKNIEFSSDIIVESTAYYVNKTLYEAIHTANNNFISRWGGAEVQRRGYKITIDDRIGRFIENNYVEIKSGRNLTGFEANTNIDEVITRIVPSGYNGITTNEPIDSPLIDKYKYVRTAEVAYKHVKLSSDLEVDENGEYTNVDDNDLIFDSLEKAQIKLEELALLDFLKGVDKLRAEYKINFIDLSKTEEYKDYAKAEHVQLGDEVSVIEEKHDINIVVRAIKRIYDVLNQETIEIELSNYDVSEEDEEIAEAIKEVENKLDSVVEKVEYLNASCAKIDKLQAVEIKVQKIEGDIAEFGDLSATNAKIENLEANKANITDLEVAVADIVTLKAKDAEIENLVANKATIENLNATNAEIENLKARDVEIENLVASKATIENLNATNAEITNLKAKDAEIEEIVSNIITTDNLEAIRAEIQKLQAKDVDIMELMADKATIESLKATNGEIDNLKAKDAEFENLTSNLVSAGDLKVITGDIYDLKANVTRTNDLLSGNLSSSNIATLKLVTDNATIQDATIASIDAGTINTGTLNTSLLRIEDNSSGGRASMVIYKSKQFFFDKEGILRMQLGLDATGDFSLIIKNAEGNNGILMTEQGIQSGAFIGDRIIGNTHISDNANITGSKLNIGSVIEGINEDNTTYLKSNRIYIDEANQTLDIQFKSLENRLETIENVTIDGDLSSVVEQVTTNKTAISVIQGEIDTLVEQTTITKDDGSVINISDAFSETKQTVNSLSSQVSSLSTNYNKFDGQIESITNKQTTMEQTLDGFTNTVREVSAKMDATETKVNQVQQQVSSTAIKNTVSNYVYSKEEIDYLINSAKKDVEEGAQDQYVTQDEMTSLRELSESQMVQTSKDFTMKFSETKYYTQEVENELIDYKEEVATNIRFSSDGIELGKSNSPFKTVLDNEKLAFVENGTEVAYISNQKMHITNAEVEEELQMGQFSWNNINGHLRLRRVKGIK